MNISLLLKGAVMGIAEAIPGVSGGTIAFITGIYQELIETIKSITPKNLKLALTDRGAFWKAINGWFILWLLLGMAVGLILGVLIIGHLLENHQSLLWATFFGLILGSIFYLGKGLKWNVKSICAALIGALITYVITTLTPVSGFDHPLYIVFSGALAISALMLPGISGSFILLILGLYSTIIGSLKALITELDMTNVIPLALFSAGALVGLFSFARILSFLFRKYELITMGIMIGVLIGSLNKLWPWKKIIAVFDKDLNIIIPYDAVRLTNNSEYKIMSEVNLLPGSYSTYEDPRIIAVMLCFSLGLILVIVLTKLDQKAPA